MEEKIIQLDRDESATCLKDIKDIISEARYLYELVEKNELDEEMKENLCSLLEFNMASISKIIGYDGLSQEKIEEKYGEIKRLRNQIYELEEKIKNNAGNENIIDKIPNQLNYLTDLVEKWWKIEGFRYIKEIFYRRFGALELHLGFSFSDFSSLISETPITDKENHKTWVEQVEDMGYKLIKERNDVDLLDCDINRELICKLIKSRFPSSEIMCWENYNCININKPHLFKLKGVEVIIRNLEEVKALELILNKNN